MFRPYPKSEQIGDKVIKMPKPKQRKTTGEAEIFRAIWLTRKHECSNCKEPLQDPPLASYFSHRLSKKQHPELRLDPNNVDLHCTTCHNLRDAGTKEQYQKRFKK